MSRNWIDMSKIQDANKQIVFLTSEHSDVIRTPFVGNQSSLPSHHHQSKKKKYKKMSEILTNKLKQQA